MATWNTVDSDPAVFNSLVEQLGVKDIQVEELYLLDDIRNFDPIYGVIFLFKYYAKSYKKSAVGTSTDHADINNIYFARQLISNACGTQAVLNILLNKDDELDIGDELKNFKSFTSEFDSTLKGESMSNSEPIRTIHNSFSSPNLLYEDDTDDHNARDSKNDGLFHFIGYIEKNGRIYELDGLRAAPIDHGEVEDNVKSSLMKVIQDKINTFDTSELRFSLLCITNNKLKQYQEIDDQLMIDSELQKRKIWNFENLLRKQDFTGLNVEIIRLISSQLDDKEWNELKNKARKP